ncbi:lytic transglycosylase domain-containing protein [Neorhizobium sp. P12A]|nr:lytic transglycosylase domain-containing protein [Neorhizobium sp. P12A]
MVICLKSAISLRCAIASTLLLASAGSSKSFEIKQFMPMTVPTSGQQPIRWSENNTAPIALLPDREAIASLDESAAAENKFGYHPAVTSPSSGDSRDARNGLPEQNKYRYLIDNQACGSSHYTTTDITRLVRAAADRYAVDPDFAVAIAWTESRLDESRNSPRGARGPMQLMPQTAARFGVADICDSAANIDGGVRYLRALLDEFKNPLLAAAAYNAGEQAIYDSNGVPAYPETVRYVASVINRELGIALPAKSLATSQQAPLPRTGGASSVSDVIGARPGTFVAGVLQISKERIKP